MNRREEREKKEREGGKVGEERLAGDEWEREVRKKKRTLSGVY